MPPARRTARWRRAKLVTGFLVVAAAGWWLSPDVYGGSDVPANPTSPVIDPTHGDIPASELDAFLAALDRSADEGLEREDFAYSRLVDARRAPSADSRQALEDSFRTFVHVLQRGRVEPSSLGSGWERLDRSQSSDDAALFDQFRAGEPVAYETLGPQEQRFRALKEALARYRVLGRSGGWPVLSLDSTPDDIIRRLGLEGDAGEGADEQARMSSALTRYQSRHGIHTDGKLGRETLASLNVPVDDRIRTIVLNLERWRWLPRTLEPRRVEVNIPSFELAGFNAGRPELRMRAVVGKDDQPTPILRSEITSIDVNPDWEAPRSIAVKEILPHLKRDPRYLEREHIELLDRSGSPVSAPSDWSSYSEDNLPFRFRQVPGPWSVVGPLKFAFANHYGVYLHGTPSPGLFARDTRGLSHGCVRLEDPLRLAEFASAGTDWPRERIAGALEAGELKTLRVSEPLPLYLTYWTAWVDDAGVVHFADDVYRGDAALLRALEDWSHQRAGQPRTST